MVALAKQPDIFQHDPVTVKRGDIWQLGNHRLMCGDSTDAENITRLLQRGGIDLIFADPPYGVKERTQRKSAGRGKLAECNDFPAVIGDDRPFDPTFLLTFPARTRIIWGANHFANRLPTSAAWLIWDKRDGIASNDNADCEMAWTDARGPARLFHHRWNGMIKASEQQERRVHPTQKPVKLAEWCFERYSKQGDSVFDPYAGSGISILASENTGRTVYAMELSPEYCMVAINRWQAMTGQKAVLA